MSEEIYQELNYILDENLSGVLSIYNGMVDTKNTTISNQQQWITQYERVIDKILIVSKADIHGRILYANDNFLNISGYTRSELIGASHNIVRHPDMPKAVFKNVWKTLLSKKPWSGVIENMTKSGTSYYVSTIIIPILDVNGEIIEFLSSRTDLTELFTLKHEKERSEELLMKQSASAEMGDMISLISHQWKQPLASISSIVNNIIVQKELNIEPTDTGIEEFQEINKLVQYLSETIDDFRVFFKPDKVKKEINVFQTVQSTLTLMQARLKVLDIKVSVDEENAFNISLYENDLKQVLLNIYNNTADMVEEKKIQNARLDISFEQDNNIGKIIIEDNGSGIDETLLPSKLFEIYETTKGDKGTGIGLQLCKIIVENKFHGKIYAQNKNDGASFTIELALS